MRELLRNAVNGWFEYTEEAKYIVFFLGVLLIFWCRKDLKGRLFAYAALTSALCVCPLTAVLLMKYQTRFYDYVWVWSLVPVTMVTAYGLAALFLDCCRKNFRGQYLKPAVLMALGLAALFLCGRPQTENREGLQAQNGEQAAQILDILEKTGDTGDICLWAPQEILTCIRGMDGKVRLLYGRNMWEEALNAYAYDVYDRETVLLYRWMEDLEDQETSGTLEGAEGQEETKSLTAGEDALRSAVEKGVNCIVLPAEKAEKTESLIDAAAGDWNLTVTRYPAAGYYIYRLEKGEREA